MSNQEGTTREGRKEALFNLKAVIRQTGLKPDTLRAWERRYGLPVPERSEGQHRLYSQRDIDTIKWLVARQEEGLSISRAVELWRQLEAGAEDPLTAPLPLAQAPVHPVPRAGGDLIGRLRRDWVAACLAYDESLADQVLSQAFALHSPETVSIDLLLAAVAEIGDLWYRGEATVDQEHFATELAIRRLEGLIIASPPPTRPGRILMACPPGEAHTLSLLVLTYLIRRRGWEALYFGANLPAEQLEKTLAITRPRLVTMSAQLLYTAAALVDVADVLRRAGVPLAYGGRVFNLLPALRERIPGHFLGERLDQAPQVVEMLMATPRPAPSATPAPAASRQARDHFLERRQQIEASLIGAVSTAGIDPEHLDLANRELAFSISAALTLGDISFAGTSLEWAEGLLDGFHLPSALLTEYLEAYHVAARAHLDGRGQPILDWLEGLTRQSH